MQQIPTCSTAMRPSAKHPVQSAAAVVTIYLT